MKYAYRFVVICLLSFYQFFIDSCDKFTGGRLNKKDGLTRYGNSHVKDKTS